MLKPNFEAEQAACGVILLEAQTVMPNIASILTADDFHVPEFRAIYDTCDKLFRESKSIDAVTVLSTLGDEYRQTIMTAVAVTPSIRHHEAYAQQVQKRSQEIRAYEKTADLLLTLESTDDTCAYQEKAEEILKCFVDKNAHDAVSAEEGYLNFYDRLNSPRKYISTGLNFLDERLFLENGDFVIVGGRPSSGKTALSLQFSLHMAREHNVVFFSLETGPNKIYDRAIANYCDVPLGQIKKNRIPEKTLASLANKFTDFKGLRFHTVQASGMTVEQIKSKALQLHAEIIFIDYLTLIHADGKTPYERASSISLGLHTLAQKHGVTIFALAQLNRHGEEELDMTSLRDSGQIEQDADVILLLDSPNLQAPDALMPNRDLIIAKNKEGNVGSFRMDFDGDKQRFSIKSTDV